MTVTKLDQRFCKACGKPIRKGESYFEVATPEGREPIHARCIGKHAEPVPDDTA